MGFVFYVFFYCVAFRYIDNNQDKLISRLADAVTHQSVGGSPHLREECHKIVHWTEKVLILLSFFFIAFKNFKILQDLGAKTELVEHPNNVELDYPPVLLASIVTSIEKPTICVFGHLDVQSALRQNENWETDPFVLTEMDGYLYGRGSTDDKGPCCAWLNCIEAYQNTKHQLPCNVKFVFDCMEGSDNLEKAIEQRKDFFENVSFVCISDNHWLTADKPSITYGLRGACYFSVTVECSKRDLHSGIYGGAVHEAMWDLMAILDSLVSSNGQIQIPGINEMVAPLNKEEEQLYENINFDVEKYWKDETGAPCLLNNLQNDKIKLLMNRWRFPSLTIHGIEGAFSDSGAKTVIPRKVTGKFSIRLVPNQTPEEVEKCVKDHVESVFKARHSPNQLTFGKVICGVAPWVADVKHPSIEAAKMATKRVWGVDPDLTREGGSMPAALTFESMTNVKAMLLPIGQSTDGAHSNRERMSKTNYLNGSKLFAAFLEEFSHISD